VAAKVPFGWVTMDGGYGQYPQVRNWMAAQGLPYVVATSAALPLTQSSVAPGTVPISRADDLPSRLADHDWQRRSCGEGSKGGRYYDWALIALGGNLHVSDETPADGFAHTLLIRRSIADPVLRPAGSGRAASADPTGPPGPGAARRARAPWGGSGHTGPRRSG